MTKEEAIAELNELNHLRKAMDIQQNKLESIQANIYGAKSVHYDLAKVKTGNTTSRLEEDVVNLETERERLLDLVTRYNDLQAEVKRNIKGMKYWHRNYIMDVYIFGVKFRSYNYEISGKKIAAPALEEYAALRTAQGA